ncbi:MAG: MBL fold metallo-hydrolase [Prevotella sp.]|jgi:glyoxylase-like metal-dependent hydrolase (beta-lactamase superfamily II)|uniref:MBL fold metallo-hydrolase n=1 Tax=unclassified Dysgonomonas TaxID=2630389 RepID=UPI0025C4C996|nr:MULTISPECIES: MBL fold metallo-hydrolase [unclassified Dysgonomonas]MDR1505285.1 MBL fold metallo-hydrolase [Prevotella sp.]MDR1716045.1 MBL fold metallo-hydrolase [Prevotella sp.]MDR2004901.1 MBL fold metallo-hydrolase [Prevotella sp.]HMM01685.1 MBL fold metallo-hydrolase [Dysgonomonas sp.]
MNVKIFEFNPISENTYVAYDETKECVIIDPGCFFPDEKALLLNFILDNDLVVKHLLNTHLHFDHIFGNNFIYEQFHLETEANKGDEFLLEQLPAQLQMFGFKNESAEIPRISKYLNENDVVTFGNQRFIVLEIPGHSPGSIIFYNQDAGCAFVGDVLFRGSVGRTDLAGGSHGQLIAGIKSKLLTLPKETVIYSGHGPLTTIGEEIKSNFYLQ